MNIREFVDGYNKNVTDNLKNRYIKDSLIGASYISFSKKCSIAERVIKATCYEKDMNGKDTGNIYINSSARYLLFILTLINEYTNIDVDFANSLDEYDSLEENNLLGIFIGEDNSIISQDEYNRCQAILNMHLDDTMQNEFSTHAFIKNQVERFGTLIGASLSPIIDAINNMDEKQADIILEKLSKILK